MQFKITTFKWKNLFIILCIHDICSIFFMSLCTQLKYLKQSRKMKIRKYITQFERELDQIDITQSLKMFLINTL